jgi:hypothetical protein
LRILPRWAGVGLEEWWIVGWNNNSFGVAGKQKRLEREEKNKK